MTKEQEETVDWLLNETVKAALAVIGAYLVGWAFTKGVKKAIGKNLRGIAVYELPRKGK